MKSNLLCIHEPNEKEIHYGSGRKDKSFLKSRVPKTGHRGNGSFCITVGSKQGSIKLVNSKQIKPEALPHTAVRQLWISLPQGVEVYRIWHELKISWRNSSLRAY